MKRWFSLVALLPLAAVGRPLLIPPIHLELPLPAEEAYPGQWGPEYASVAIDGDIVLASARRTIDTNNDTINGVYIFQRAADGSWHYAGPLVEGLDVPPRVLMNGNVATLTTFTSVPIQVYERTAAGWSLTASIADSGAAIRIEDGSIYTQPNGTQGSNPCSPPYREFRKVNGSWQQVATIGSERCGYDYYPEINDGRAIIVSSVVTNGTLPPVPLFRKVNGTWPQVATFPEPPPSGNTVSALGTGTLNASLAYFAKGSIFRNTGGDSWTSAGSYVQPEVDLNLSYGTPTLRGANLLLPGAEGDYDLPSHDIDYSQEYQTVRIYRPASDGSLSYFARLGPDWDIWGWSPSEDGRRIAAFGANNNFGDDPASRLYVFEIPDSHTFPSLQQDNFESGNFSRWTASAGQFAVAQNGATRVLRQSSLAGDAGATLTAIDWTDQAIEADLRPLEFSGSGRWFGLVTRRTDASNYYYVTLRAPDIVSLRRVQNGVVTELASNRAPEPFALGRSYRVRLESVGDLQAVFLEGLPRVYAKDTALTHGHPGVAGFRTRFEVDNVTITGGTRLLTLQDSMETFYRSRGYDSVGAGTWIQIDIDEEQSSFHFYKRQTDTSGDARVFSTYPLGNQAVSARLRPQAWGSGGDPWVGIAARVVDDRNYLYLSLRRSGQLSLRKVVNGAIQVIATAPFAVATNQWYDLRLEVIANHIRGFVNGDLKFELDDPGIAASGRNGVLMYKASADLWAWTSYQP